MYPHRIRLRGPWHCQPITNDDQTPQQPIRMKMPCRWRDGGLGDFRGCVRFTRRFGYPGRIDAFERVWLTFAQWYGQATIQLNDVRLGREITPADFPIELEVTGLLKSHNSLDVTLCDETGQGGLTGEVAMEIRCTSYLRNVRAKRTGGKIQVFGDIIGVCNRPLEIYVQCDDENVGYQELNAANDSTPFRLAFDRPPQTESSNLIRVELVNVSTIWYVVELNVEVE